MEPEPSDLKQGAEKDGSGSRLAHASTPLRLLAPKLAPPSAKMGLVGLPTELLLGLVTDFLLREDSAENSGQRTVLNLMKTCRKMYADLAELFYENAFSDDARAHFLLGWACVHGQMALAEFALSRPNIDVNRPVRFRGGSNKLAPLQDQDRPKLPISCARFKDMYRNRDDPPKGWMEMPPLHLAIICQRPEMVEVLLRHSARTDSQDSYHRTPLCHATDEGQVAMLLQAGASPLKDGPWDRDPLKCMLSSPRFWLSGSEKPRFSAAAFRRLLAAKRRVCPHWSIDEKTGSKCKNETLLRVAISEGFEQMCELLKAGADPNGTVIDPRSRSPCQRVESEHMPPLQLAFTAYIKDQALDTVKLLVGVGARVNQVYDLDTVLTRAILAKKADIVEWLTQEAGADPNIFEDADAQLACEHSYWCFDKGRVGDFCLRSPLTRALRDAEIPALPLLEQLVKFGADTRRMANLPTLEYVFHLLHQDDRYKRRQDSYMDIRKVAELLVDNGADIHQTITRTSWYLAGWERPKRRPAMYRLTRYDYFDFPTGSLTTHYERKFEPALGQAIFIVKSVGALDAHKDCIMRHESGCPHRWRLFQHHSKWSMLDEAMVFGDKERVEILLHFGFDPLHNLTHSSQMRNTALGKLIRFTNFFHREESRFMGPWTTKEWEKAEYYLRVCGPATTAKFPVGLLAQLLAQAVARLEEEQSQQRRILEVARLTNYNDRWGKDGISGLEALVEHPAYWYLFERRRHLGGYFASDERQQDLWHNLWQAATIVRDLAKKTGWAVRRSQLEREVHLPETFRRPRYQPLPETEYCCAFAVLFGEQTSQKSKSRRKGRGKRKGVCATRYVR